MLSICQISTFYWMIKCIIWWIYSQLKSAFKQHRVTLRHAVWTSEVPGLHCEVALAGTYKYTLIPDNIFIISTSNSHWLFITLGISMSVAQLNLCFLVTHFLEGRRYCNVHFIAGTLAFREVSSMLKVTQL